MADRIIMPKAGMSMEKGTIIKWLKEVGDPVEYGEPILEIETDKTSMQVEAMNEGYILAQYYGPGDEVPVVTTIGYIGKKGEQVNQETRSSVSKVEEPPKQEASSKTGQDERYDIVVVGGGPAGYIAAIKAARLGAKTALVEKSELGGTCLNRGCIPTKTYLKTAEGIHQALQLKTRGVTFKNLDFTVDMNVVVDEKNKVVKKLTGGVAALLKSNGVAVYRGSAVIRQDKSVVVDQEQILHAEKVIFAGGSVVSRINIPGIDCRAVLTSDEILDMKTVPKNLVVIGGGVIGVEMASVFSALGSHVTILEMMDRIVPAMEPEISSALKKKLLSDGIDVRVGEGITSIEQKGDIAQVHTEKGEMLAADCILLSIGRVPDLSGIEGLDVAVERGRVVVDEWMKTSLDWLYAPGDVNGKMMLAHAAFHMAETAVLHALGESEAQVGKSIPACIYTQPEIACIGMGEEEARKRHEISVGKFAFSGNGRALASGEGEGFVKVLIQSTTGEILGIHIMGPGAAEMINEASVLMAMEITAFEVPHIVHAHPTFSEALMEAVADSVGQSLHLPKRR